ncbi:hypothetical protein ACFOZ7_06620 [Natribaculum luteum]|uniref:Uncharacterized protein n=1 Tax=Natribaculum luteum TaxID=1586232 RepID=A0ABD5NXA9_9EURY|nr:hypothetical protein [Natribaculum luteum]
MFSDQHAQDDLLIVMALARLAHDFRDADPQLADRAWWLAVEIAASHRLTPSEAVLRVE